MQAEEKLSPQDLKRMEEQKKYLLEEKLKKLSK